MKWTYHEQFNPADYKGFVYLVTNKLDGRIYIGKKSFWSNRALTKAQLKKQTDKRRKRIIQESNWKEYNSSCKELIDNIEKLGEHNFKFEILRLCKSVRELSYYEVYYQFEYKVLHVPSYNKNILGRFFQNSI